MTQALNDSIKMTISVGFFERYNGYEEDVIPNFNPPVRTFTLPRSSPGTRIKLLSIGALAQSLVKKSRLDGHFLL